MENQINSYPVWVRARLDFVIEVQQVSAIQTSKRFRQRQNTAVSLFNLAEIAETVNYFVTIRNFFRIAQLLQEVVHLGPADRVRSR